MFLVNLEKFFLLILFLFTSIDHLHAESDIASDESNQIRIGTGHGKQMHSPINQTGEWCSTNGIKISLARINSDYPSVKYKGLSYSSTAHFGHQTGIDRKYYFKNDDTLIVDFYIFIWDPGTKKHTRKKESFVYKRCSTELTS